MPLQPIVAQFRLPDDHAFIADNRSTSVDLAIWGCWIQPRMCRPDASRLDLIRLLLQHCDIEYDYGRYIGPAEGFMLCQQAAGPAYYVKPLEERVRIAIGLAYGMHDPETVRASIAVGSLPPLTHTVRDDSGNSLLHAVAWNIGYTFALIPPEYPTYFRPGYKLNRKGERSKQDRVGICGLTMTVR